MRRHLAEDERGQQSQVDGCNPSQMTFLIWDSRW